MLTPPSSLVLTECVLLSLLLLHHFDIARSIVYAGEVTASPPDRPLRFIRNVRPLPIRNPQHRAQNSDGGKSMHAKEETPKILVWTPSLSISNFSGTYLVQLLKRDAALCPFECTIDTRPRLNESGANAIIFHSRTMVTTDLPKSRELHQVYVWLCHEEPTRCGEADKTLPRNYFNTSFTNLRDQETYFYGYGEITRTENENLLNRITDDQWELIISKKRNLGLAVISNCFTTSRREIYLQRLSHFVDLTFLGSCYDAPVCAKGQKDTADCMSALFDSHFFYFAFENNVCKDYVTEKFFDRLNHAIVPVVLRRSVLNGVAPADAFIAADDFASPEQLANYLIRVSRDPQLYRTYFKWRDSHAITELNSAGALSTEGNGICALCRDLMQKSVRTSSSYVVRSHYSPSLCEAEVGWKLLKNNSKEKKRRENGTWTLSSRKTA